jgi:Protein of unknown function (DUF3489)
MIRPWSVGRHGADPLIQGTTVMFKSKKANVTAEPANPPHVTKTAKLLTLMQTGTGASLEEMVEVTGWQSHTVRAAMTGLRKKGHIIDKHLEGNTTIWSVKPAA